MFRGRGHAAVGIGDRGPRDVGMHWEAWRPPSVTLDAIAVCRRQRGAGCAWLAAEAPAQDRAERSCARPAPEYAERSSCMTSAQFASWAGSARSRSSATTGTARRTGCSSCTCSPAPRPAARSPWRPSPATRPIAGGESRGLGARQGQGGTKRAPDGPPVHSFRTLLDDLSGKSLIQLRLPGHGTVLLRVVTVPTGCRNGPSSSSA